MRRAAVADVVRRSWIASRRGCCCRRGLRVGLGLRVGRRLRGSCCSWRRLSASAARSFSSSRCTASSCEPLLLDLLQSHDLGLGLRLERLERFALGLRLRLLIVEIGAHVLELVDRGREVVHVRQRAPVAALAKTFAVACEFMPSTGVNSGLPTVIPCVKRCTAAADRLSRSVATFGLHLRQLGLFGGDLEIELVDPRLGVEHRLGGGIGAIARVLDLARRPLGLRAA